MPTGRKAPFAKRSLGQNFLVDQNYLKKIIDAVDACPDDTIIEIGPGRGAITEQLVESGANVIAIELDREFVSLLNERFIESENFRVIEADASNIDLGALIAPTSSAKLVANLPYNVSTAILQALAKQRQAFSSLILMFQKEVVDRITAMPGNSERGYLTVIIEFAFTSEKLFDVPPTAFRPVPKVDSSVVRLTPKPPSIADSGAFEALVSLAFRQKRKTLANNLKAVYPNISNILDSANIPAGSRAEALTLAEWLRLFRELSADM